MRAVSRCLLGACLALAAMATPACTLAVGHIAPTNYELVRLTPTILWAQAVSADADAGDRAQAWKQRATVTFEVKEVIKGSFGPATLTLDGDGETYDGPGDDSSFSGPRPGSERGACNAYDYRVGTAYLIFLNPFPHPDYRHLDGPAFSRINEEADATSPWLATVRQYARIAALNDAAAERRELQALLAQSRAHAGDPRYPRQLPDDIERHFRTPTHQKSFEELQALFTQPRAGKDQKADALWAMATAPKPPARPLFERLIRSGAWRSHPDAALQFTHRTQDAALLSLLLAQLPGIRVPETRQSLLRTAVALADARETPQMLHALRVGSVREVRLLKPWFEAHPSPAATAVLERRWTPPYEDDSTATFTAAGEGDPEVLAWAQRLIRTRDENTWMGYYVIARSPLPLADQLARQVIRTGSSEGLVSLIQGYQESTNPNLWDRLGDVVAMARRSKGVDYWLREVLSRRAEAGDGRAKGMLREIGAGRGVKI